ncbi:PREDICTED: WUSCHEL-related homeobox 11-like isoform X1 [Lupinus angustifolius]|uniref:WUSCHEL-related homeobox 11-like isoform X1 n=1 Tax=Lupinus angustifolius TaxID=3871 RepID=UPI00092F13B1|nr:PREDICTED: WUSCHEL-related homeobox 11-like isoform X1 [Lupinus angustifolius]
MEHQVQQDPNRNGSEKSEPVRSRWTPKPEQILILESIFNSGMVNPPKDETVRIRKLLEKFGTVGDANVFYWFQNRRSRSRRCQRQMQASLEQRNQMVQPPQVGVGAIPYHHANTSPTITATAATATTNAIGSSSSFTDSSSSCCGILGGQENIDSFFSISPQMGFSEIDYSSAATSVFYPSPVASNWSNQSVGFGGTNISGFITVFINGIATEVPREPLDIKRVFGEDVMLVHSSGIPLPTNEFGFLMQSLHHGDSYFLVSKPTHGMN